MNNDVPNGVMVTSARLTEEEAKIIDEIIKTGYFSSRAEFVLDALRVVSMEIINNLAALYPNLPEKHSVTDLNDLISSAITKKFIYNSGYANEPRKRYSVLVGLNGKQLFLSNAIDIIKKYLNIKDLQGVVGFVVFYRLNTFLEYSNNIQQVEKFETEIEKEFQGISLEDETDELLRKSGLLHK